MGIRNLVWPWGLISELKTENADLAKDVSRLSEENLRVNARVNRLRLDIEGKVIDLNNERRRIGKLNELISLANFRQEDGTFGPKGKVPADWAEKYL